MKTIEQLEKKLNAMSEAELRDCLFNVMVSLYGDHCDDYGNSLPEIVFNPDKEWTGDTIENVASDLNDSGLHPNQL